MSLVYAEFHKAVNPCACCCKALLSPDLSYCVLIFIFVVSHVESWKLVEQVELHFAWLQFSWLPHHQHALARASVCSGFAFRAALPKKLATKPQIQCVQMSTSSFVSGATQQ
eukprot:2077433-Amphidinium_carterae.1